jgi:hypothetical protein
VYYQHGKAHQHGKVRTVVAAASNGRRKASAANRRHFFPLLDIDWLSGDKDEYQDVKK